jgi:hypothetical protein
LEAVLAGGITPMASNRRRENSEPLKIMPQETTTESTPKSGLPSHALFGVWQPIKTAPKDGTIILICTATSGTYGIAVMKKWTQHGETKWIATEDGPFQFPHATHWMPLPPMPNAEL